MQADDALAVSSTGLFGLVLHPEYIGCPLVTATAVHRNGVWMCRLYGSNRLAEHRTKEGAAGWIREWGNADLIIEAIECPPNELDDWHNAAKHVDADHPDEVHCGCVPILRKKNTDLQSWIEEIFRMLGIPNGDMGALENYILSNVSRQGRREETL